MWCYILQVQAQNIGIDNPTPLEKLDVNGAIKIGSTTENNAGTIQYDGSDIKGHDGTQWRSLTEGVPSGTIIMREEKNDTLLEMGYKYYGYHTLEDIRLADSSQLWVNTNSEYPSYPMSIAIEWTGDQVLTYGDNSDWAGGIYDPLTDVWDTMSTINAPSLRRGHNHVYTDSEMIIWGGYASGNSLSDGTRYNPTTVTWTTMSAVNAPSGSSNTQATWTGTEMIVWGGTTTSQYADTLSDGGRYNPITDTWTIMSDVGAPSGRCVHAMIWTGTELIVWGGYEGSSALSDGAKYNPSTDTWTPITSVGAPTARAEFSSVWTGDKMIVWSGWFSGSTGIWSDGYSYDPVLDEWAPISDVNAPFQRRLASTTWTGEEMIVVAGLYGSTYIQEGGKYNPTTDTWTTISSNFAPSQIRMKSVWTGENLISHLGSNPKIWCEHCGVSNNMDRVMHLYIRE